VTFGAVAAADQQTSPSQTQLGPPWAGEVARQPRRGRCSIWTGRKDGVTSPVGTRSELNLGPLLPLDTLLPEMRRKASQPGPSTQPASHAPAPRRGRRLDWATSGPQIAPTAGLDDDWTERSAVQAARGEQ
jgi:hypothetical protein